MVTETTVEEGCTCSPTASVSGLFAVSTVIEDGTGSLPGTVYPTSAAKAEERMETENKTAMNNAEIFFTVNLSFLIYRRLCTCADAFFGNTAAISPKKLARQTSSYIIFPIIMDDCRTVTLQGVESTAQFVTLPDISALCA
jgi:hypothetical protein